MMSIQAAFSSADVRRRSRGEPWVLLADDNMLVVETFKKLLQNRVRDHATVSEVAVSWLLAKVKPDVLIVDIVICVDFLTQRFCSANKIFRYDVNDPTARSLYIAD